MDVKLDSSEIYLTDGQLCDYLSHLQKKGHTTATIAAYGHKLKQLQKFLSPSYKITATTGLEWKQAMELDGYSRHTIASCLCALNGYLAYHGKKAWTLRKGKVREAAADQSPLTRNDYYLMLKAAKHLGRYRAYLLIKTFVLFDIKTQELHYLTREALQQGSVQIPGRCSNSRCVTLPNPLRLELLAYAVNHGIQCGPIFITKYGTPLLHSAIWKDIKYISRRTGLLEEIGTPRNLHRLYLATYRSMYTGPYQQVNSRYLALLREEEKTIAWAVL